MGEDLLADGAVGVHGFGEESAGYCFCGEGVRGEVSWGEAGFEEEFLGVGGFKGSAFGIWDGFDEGEGDSLVAEGRGGGDEQDVVEPVHAGAEG